MRQKQSEPPSERVREQQPGTLRRSVRERRQPRNDDYFMGYNYLEDVIGEPGQDEDYNPKRRRKNYRFDDSEDYSEGHRPNKKTKIINPNKIESLLEWKFQPRAQDIQIVPLPSHTQPTPLQILHKVKFTKFLSSQNLPAIANDLQAVFVNIDWNKPHQSLKDFQQLKLQSTKLMSKGLVFVWAPKAELAQLLTIMENKGFVYVQNLQVVNFDIQKARKYLRGDREKKEDRTESQVDFASLLRAMENVDPCEVIADQSSEFFNVSKRTLLMFRKNSNSKFELRHQRTCDVVFDMPWRLGHKCQPDLKGYIYNMIETLLPECLVIQQLKKNQFGFKMLQLWGDKDQYRPGWITIIQE